MNLHEAAAQIGVHYQTMYRWVRDGSVVATKLPSNVYDVTNDEVERFAAKRAQPALPPAQIRVRSWDRHVDRLLQAVLGGDELAARTTIDRLVNGSVSVVELCEHVIAPCLNEVGNRWHSGTVTIAEEHRATAICQRIVARLSSHPRGRPRGTAVVTTAVGELHTLPSDMAALALRHDRWKTHHLGGNVPVDDVLALAHDVNADLIVISTTNSELSRSVKLLVDALTRSGRQTLIGRPGMSLQLLVEQARALGRDHES